MSTDLHYNTRLEEGKQRTQSLADISLQKLVRVRSRPLRSERYDLLLQRELLRVIFLLRGVVGFEPVGRVGREVEVRYVCED